METEYWRELAPVLKEVIPHLSEKELYAIVNKVLVEFQARNDRICGHLGE